MFYDRFYKLCQDKGVTPTQAVRDIGVRQSTASMWKKQGTTPKAETLLKMSQYFSVPMAYLTGDVDSPDDRSKTHWREVVGDDDPETENASEESFTIFLLKQIAPLYKNISIGTLFSHDTGILRVDVTNMASKATLHRSFTAPGAYDEDVVIEQNKTDILEFVVSAASMVSKQ